MYILNCVVEASLNLRSMKSKQKIEMATVGNKVLESDLSPRNCLENDLGHASVISNSSLNAEAFPKRIYTTFESATNPCVENICGKVCLCQKGLVESQKTFETVSVYRGVIGNTKGETMMILYLTVYIDDADNVNISLYLNSIPIIQISCCFHKQFFDECYASLSKHFLKNILSEATIIVDINDTTLVLQIFLNVIRHDNLVSSILQQNTESTCTSYPMSIDSGKTVCPKTFERYVIEFLLELFTNSSTDNRIEEIKQIRITKTEFLDCDVNTSDMFPLLCYAPGKCYEVHGTQCLHGLDTIWVGTPVSSLHNRRTEEATLIFCTYNIYTESDLQTAIFEARMALIKFAIADTLDKGTKYVPKGRNRIKHKDAKLPSLCLNTSNVNVASISDAPCDEVTLHILIPWKLEKILSTYPCEQEPSEPDYIVNSINSTKGYNTTQVVSLDTERTHIDLDSEAQCHEETVELTKNAKEHQSATDIVRDLTWLPVQELPIPVIDLTVANVLDPIFEQIVHGNTPGPHITMKYELLRLCTFRNYPKVNKPYIIRLAGAGYYYAADGDEVVCYCCGIRRRSWTENCIPLMIHKRMSPKCSFLTRNSEVNVPVPNEETGEEDRFAFLRELLSEPPLGYEPESGYDIPISAQFSMSSSESSSVSTTQTSVNQRIGTSESRLHEVETPPNYPHYGVRQTRLASFQGWLPEYQQSPEVLADAGFYYAGIGDCVRCFQCGVGLRHWESEDDPWIEHGRWTLDNPCPYLIKMKGTEYIALIRMALEVTQNETPSVPSVDEPRQSVQVHDTSAQSSVVVETNVSRGQNKDVKSTSDTKKEVNEHKHTELKEKTKAASESHARHAEEEERRSLKKENTKLKSQTLCKVCFERDVCIVFLPCGHLVTCAECAPSLRICAVCRQAIKGTVKTYMA